MALYRMPVRQRGQRAIIGELYTAATTLMPLVLLGAAGCGKPYAGGAGVPGAVIRYPLSSEPETLDPYSTETWGDQELVQNVFEPLVRLDEQCNPVPCLADRWSISKDGRTYVFSLVRNARFQAPYDRPLTAGDVKYTFERALWPETKSLPGAEMFRDIVGASDVMSGRTRRLRGVRVIDPYTLSVELVRPRSYFLQTACVLGVLCHDALEAHGGVMDEKSAIGTGPYRVAAYRHGASIVLVANDAYRSGKPQLDRIERPIVRATDTAHIMYERGELDLIIPALQDLIRDRADPSLRDQIRPNELLSTRILVMHPKMYTPFADVRVRRAFAMAIDRGEVARVAYNGLCKLAGAYVPGRLLPYGPGSLVPSYDPAAARRLIAEAGYGPSRPLPRLVITTVRENLQRSAAAQIIRDNLHRNLGVPVDIEEREATSFMVDRGKENMACYEFGWGEVTPHGFLTLFRTGSRMNSVGYTNSRFDALFDSADAEMDENKGKALYLEAERVALADVAVLPVVEEIEPYLVKPYVKNLQINPVGLMPLYRTNIAPHKH